MSAEKTATDRADSLTDEVAPSAPSTGAGHKPSDEPAGAWWKVYGSFLVFANIWGLPLTYGAFQSFYTLQHLPGVSVSAVSWVGTLQAALLVACGVVAGPLYDLGYWKALWLTGCFMCVFGMMMLSLATKYYQVLLAQGICVGIGCGLFYVPVLTLLGNLFSKNRAIAIGIATSGIALGGIVYTIVFLKLLPEVGFAWTVRVMAFLSLAIFVLAAPPLLSGLPAESGSARSIFDLAAFKDTAYVTFAVSQFLVFAGYIVPLFYIPIYSQVALKTSETVGFYVLLGAQGASLFGRIAATLPVPYIGTMIPWIFCCGISGILCFVWIGISSLDGFITFSVLYGFFSGALVALPPGVFPKICPDPKTLGSRLGMSWLWTAVATLIGSPIAGAIIDLEKADFLGVQIWSGTMLLASVVVLFLLWLLLVRRYRTMLI